MPLFSVRSVRKFAEAGRRHRWRWQLGHRGSASLRWSWTGQAPRRVPNGLRLRRQSALSGAREIAPRATYATIGIDVACDRPRAILQNRTSKIACRIDGGTLSQCVACEEYCGAEDGHETEQPVDHAHGLGPRFELRSCPHRCVSHKPICNIAGREILCIAAQARLVSEDRESTVRRSRRKNPPRRSR